MSHENQTRNFLVQGRNTAFVCLHCGFGVPPLTNGSLRNHCPKCLHSLHLDNNPGDRAANCGGLLVPISVEHSGKKGWVIVQRCARCNVVRRNKAATADNLPDDFDVLIELSKPKKF